MLPPIRLSSRERAGILPARPPPRKAAAPDSFAMRPPARVVGAHSCSPQTAWTPFAARKEVNRTGFAGGPGGNAGTARTPTSNSANAILGGWKFGTVTRASTSSKSAGWGRRRRLQWLLKSGCWPCAGRSECRAFGISAAGCTSIGSGHSGCGCTSPSQTSPSRSSRTAARTPRLGTSSELEGD